MKPKKLLALVLILSLLLSSNAFAFIDETGEDIPDSVKVRAEIITDRDFYIDFSSDDAFDGLEITKVLEYGFKNEYVNRERIVFSYKCKAKYKEDEPYTTDYNEPYYPKDYVRLGNYIFNYYTFGELYVYHKNGGHIDTLEEAYINEYITDSELEQLYNNQAYDYSKKETVTAVTDDPLNEVIKEQAGAIFGSVHEGFDLDEEGEFDTIRVEKYLNTDKFDIFSFTSKTLLDGLVTYQLGEYYFDDISDDLLYLYDKENDKMMTLKDAYDNGVIGDEVLDELCSKYFFNNINSYYVQKAEDDIVIHTEEENEALRQQVLKTFNELDLYANNTGLPLEHQPGLCGGYSHLTIHSEYQIPTLNIYLPEKAILVVSGHQTNYVTGSYVRIYNEYINEQNLVYSGTVIVPGDCYQDGKIDILDLVEARYILVTEYAPEGSGAAGVNTGFYWTNLSLCKALDVNGDGNFDIVDIAYMRNIIVNCEE